MKKIAESTVAVHTHTHTSNLDNKSNKIKERDIYKNASNCCVQSNSAITLVALVITIIVLLILAGVTLNIVIGNNGIFGKANVASENTKIANAKEIIKTAVLENEVYKKTNDEKEKTDEDLQTEIESKLEKEGYKVETGKIKIGKTEEIDIAEEIKNASTGGTVAGNPTPGKEDKSKNRTLAGTTTGYTYKNPVIPQGFKAIDVGSAVWSYKDSNKTEVTGWNEGLVIEDEIGNQFVWVPVDGSSVPYAKWCTIGLSYSSCSNDSSAIPVTENTQINTYQGFYVARFEAGLPAGNTSAVSKQGTKIWNYIDYNNANTVAKAMINNNATYGSTKSGLVTGTQWDTIMKWYKNAGIKVDTTQDWGTYQNLPYTIQPGLWFNSYTTTSTWTNSTSNVKHNANSGRYFHASGLNANGIKKNIADLGGNMWEWTAESCAWGPVSRGGCAYHGANDDPTSSRLGCSTESSDFFYGFRVVLYVL